MLTLTSALRQRVLASIPWETRLANMLFGLRIAAKTPAELLAQVAMGVFYTLNVTELDPVPKPPTNLREIANDRNVPPSVYSKLTVKVKGWANNKFRGDKNRVDEFLSEAIASVYDKAAHHKFSEIEGKPLVEAEKFLWRTLENTFNDYIRKMKRRPQDSLNDVDVSDRTSPISPSGEMDLSDTLINQLSPRILRQLKVKFPKFDISEEDIHLYLEYLSNDFSTEEIIKKKMLPFLKNYDSFAVPAWSRYKEVIMDTLKKELKTAGLVVLDLDPVGVSDATMSLTASLVGRTSK